MQKRVLAVGFVCMLISMLVLASAEKLEIIPVKETFVAGENINLKASLYDSENNPIDSYVTITLEDAEKRVQIEKVIQSNKLADISLGEGAPAGYWKITGKYDPSGGKDPIISSAIILIEINEIVKFDLKNGTLTIINIGNTQYSKDVQIVIGDTIGTKKVDLGVGERVSFRLIAPQGTYSVKVTDGKTTVAQSGVALTGKVIGILDNVDMSGNALTTGVKGEASPYDENAAPARNKSIIYIFLLIVFGAAILLIVERKYRKSAFQSSSFQLTNKTKLTN
jgi:hypothetical protein